MEGAGGGGGLLEMVRADMRRRLWPSAAGQIAGADFLPPVSPPSGLEHQRS